MKTTHTVVVGIQTPEGQHHDVKLTLVVEWGELEVNPMDKEPRMYRGEDDGRELQEVTLTDACNA